MKFIDSGPTVSEEARSALEPMTFPAEPSFTVMGAFTSRVTAANAGSMRRSEVRRSTLSRERSANLLVLLFLGRP